MQRPPWLQQQLSARDERTESDEHSQNESDMTKLTLVTFHGRFQVHALVSLLATATLDV